MSHIWKACAAAAALMTGTLVHADLVPIGGEDFQGAGLGSVNTVLTINSPGSSTFATGGVSFGDVVTGDAMTGGSQTQTRTLGELGITSASTLRVVFNPQEPGGDASGITLQDLQLSIFSPTGSVLFTSGSFTSQTFASTLPGVGNASLFVFALDAAQQVEAAAAFGAAFESNIVGLSASVGCGPVAPEGCLGATGGFETFFVANAGGTVPPIPEPGTYSLLLAGLAMTVWLGRRRSRRE